MTAENYNMVEEETVVLSVMDELLERVRETVPYNDIPSFIMDSPDLIALNERIKAAFNLITFELSGSTVVTLISPSTQSYHRAIINPALIRFSALMRNYQQDTANTDVVMVLRSVIALMLTVLHFQTADLSKTEKVLCGFPIKAFLSEEDYNFLSYELPRRFGGLLWALAAESDVLALTADDPEALLAIFNEIATEVKHADFSVGMSEESIKIVKTFFTQ